MAAYDYYAYGMLMPNRFTNDTSSQCMLVTTTKLVATWVYDGSVIAALTPKGLGNITITGTGFMIAAAGSGDGVTQSLSVQAGADQDVTLMISRVENTAFRASISQLMGTDTVELISANIIREGQYRLGFRPAGGTVYFKLVNNGSLNGSITAQQAFGWKQTLTPQTVVTRVCNDVKDGWPHGYNGQRKTNEVAGVGNWNTAEFWEYDTRTATRKNRDPKPNPGISEYSVFNGNPVLNSDALGDTIKANNETGSEITKAIEANLGKDNPFSYDKEKGILNHDKNYDLTKYSKEQKDLVNRYAALVDDKVVTTIMMVNRQEKLTDLKNDKNPSGRSLDDLNVSGITHPYFNDYGTPNQTLDHQNIFISRTPGRWTIPAGSYDFDGRYIESDKKPEFQERSTDYIGLVIHHEAAGHGFLRLTKPTMLSQDNNKAVEDFQRTFQKFYKIGGGYPYKNSTVDPH